MMADTQLIYLAGIMGSGKTSVGKRLASKLGWTFHDADNVIEAMSGNTIPEIFQEQGEEGFRKIEAAAIQQLSRSRRAVIGLGGGALETLESREIIADSGSLIWLNVPPKIAAERLTRSRNRPLIAGAQSAEDIQDELQAILNRRETNYAVADMTLELDRETPGEIASLLFDKLKPESPVDSLNRVSDDVSPHYKVYVDYGLLTRIGNLLEPFDFTSNLALITDSNVQDLYSQQVAFSLKKAGFNVQMMSVPAGESSKNLDTMEELYDYFAEAGLDRKSPAVVLGGGVIGDMGGFFAASYLRGIPLIHIPTTLLAQVDSSIGGKVGVNLSAGKNLVGDFYNPAAVIADINTLFSMPEREWHTGLGEVLKYGLIGNPEIFDIMREGPGNVREHIREVVQLSIEQKLNIVNEDFTEGNIRRFLNFGHTLGHALEKVTNYSVLNHGEAVYWGILAACFISHQKGFLKDKVFEEIIRIMEKYDFGISVDDLDEDAVRDAIYYDKKRIRDKIHWVLLRGVGQPVIETDVSKSLITDAIQYAQEFTKNQSYSAREH